MKKRLLLFLSYLGIGQTKFEEIVGLSRGLINNIKDGISSNTINKISDRYPDLDIEWLLTGNGEMLKSSESDTSDTTVSVNRTVKERLIQYIKFKGITQSNFCKSIGVSVAFITSMRVSMQPDKIKSISLKYPELNIHWLLTGNGEMFKEPQPSAPSAHSLTVGDLIKKYNTSKSDVAKKLGNDLLKKSLSDLTDEEKGKLSFTLNADYADLVTGLELMRRESTGKLVPVFDVQAATGSHQVDVYNSIQTGWINVGDLLKDSEGAIYVYGNSMIPCYPPGCLLGLRENLDRIIEPGNVYVVETENNRYIKRLYYNDDKTGYICISDNHRKHDNGPMEGSYFYPPFEIPFEMIKKTFIVTGVIKRNSNSLIIND